MENRAADPCLGAEHGLSLWVEAGSGAVLFDTGQSGVFAANASVLGADLTQTAAIILSHGHYDHTGGLCHALVRAPGAGIFTHPAALGGHYRRVTGGAQKEIGIPEAARMCLERATGQLTLTEEATPVPGGLYATGLIPRRCEFETPEEGFFADPSGLEADEFPDDQS